MRIGILTYWTSKENYGQILQLYALYTFLIQNGHDVFVIKYDGYGDASLNKSNMKRLLGFLKNPFKLIRYIKNIRKEKIIKKDLAGHDCKFSDFKNKRFKWSNTYNTFKELENNPPQADVYICGSDMIWVENGERYKAFFLGFGSDDVKRIAYAPSFGANNLRKSYQDKIKPYLDRFDLISTRENSGQDICWNMGFRNAQWFPDPTLLLEAKDYMSLITCRSRKKSYIFMYLMGHPTHVPFSSIKKFSEENSLEIIYRASQGRRDDWVKVYPQIEEWIGYMSQADYVITNSFHGCVFAIIFRKQFLFLPLIKGAKQSNDRIYSLLKRLQLEDRIWKGEISDIKKDIDYNLVNSEIKEWTEATKKILCNHLQ